MTALYSLYTVPDEQPHVGWGTAEANMVGLALSIEKARQAGFDRVVFVGDAASLRRVELCGIDIDETRDLLSTLPARLSTQPGAFWSLGKMVAMESMQEPFAHLDHDLFVEVMPDMERFAGCSAIFEMEEGLNNTYSGMISWAEEDARLRGGVLPEWWGRAGVAANCGIVVGLDLDYIHRWCRAGIEWVEDPRLRGFWRRAILAAHGPTWCVMFEQYAATCVAASMGVPLGYMDRQIHRRCDPGPGDYVHLISARKRNDAARAWAREELASLNPAALDCIEQAFTVIAP